MRQSEPHLRPAGFTLVELLVVITIIGILAALLLGAVGPALRSGREARIRAEITQFETAIEDTKNSIGAYPPNAQTDRDPQNPSTNGPISESAAQTNFTRYFNKAFPSNRESPQLIAALVGQSPTQTSDGTMLDPGEATNLVGGMTAAEALVFWLGSFSEDARYPISGPGGPSYVVNAGDAISKVSARRDPIEERARTTEIFELSRLGPRDDAPDFEGSFDQDDERFIVYADPRDPNTVRRINFWRFNTPRTTQPYVYFDTSRASSVTAANDVPAASSLINNETAVGLDGFYAIKQLRPGADNDPIQPRIRFANNNKFQVLSAGVEGEWGETPRIDPNASPTANTLGGVLIDGSGRSLPLVFPDGPWPEDLSDTISNFANGRLENETP